MVRKSSINVLGKTTKLSIFIAIVVLGMSFGVQAAWAPPSYTVLGNTVIVDGTVTGDALSGDFTGDAGQDVQINGSLGINGDNSSGIAGISLHLKNGVTGGKIKITKIDPPSGDVPPGAIGFFRIDLEGFTDADIENAEITFKVGNEYINVKLYRLSSGAWTLLSTTKVETGATTTTYKAISPGFSTFAIVADKGAAKTASSGSLPFTSGTPLYLMGVLGVLLVGAGIAMRLRSAH